MPGSNEERLHELELERALHRLAEVERDISNQLYAIKLVEHIVFGLVGLIAVGVVGALLALVLK